MSIKDIKKQIKERLTRINPKQSLIGEIEITKEDVKESLLQLKRRVGGPKISFRRRT